MNQTLKIIAGSISVLAFIAFVLWRTHVATQIKHPVYGVVADITSSHSGDRRQACLAVAGITEKLVVEAADTPGAQMEILALGDSSRGGEPLVLTTQTSIPSRTALSTGMAAIRRQQKSYVAGIYKNCLGAAAPEYSAIYLGIERMLEYTRTQRCGISSQCVVYVDTDGNENVEPSLKARLQGRQSPKQTVALDNTGIDVRFCGLAEHSVDHAARAGSTGRRQAFRSQQDPAHMEGIWQSIFKHPDQVSFEPYCAQPANAIDYLQPDAADKH